jgi:hypothetical protein
MYARGGLAIAAHLPPWAVALGAALVFIGFAALLFIEHG